MVSAQVELTQALKQQRQFVARTGGGHHLLLDDTAGWLMLSLMGIPSRRLGYRADGRASDISSPSCHLVADIPVP